MTSPISSSSPPRHGRPSWVELLGLLVALALMSVALTWPLAAHMGTAMNDYGDPLLNAWILWWDVKALTTSGLSLFDAPIFHPHTLTLAYSEHMLVSALLAAPLLLAGVDALVVHNFVFLLSFVLCGLGAYLLALELTGNRAAAWVAAVAFAFAPYRFGHMGHLQLQTAQFMPLVLYFLHRWARRPTWGNILGFGACWLAQILSCGYYALFISLAVALFYLFYGLADRWWAQRRRWVQTLVVVVLVAGVVAPLYKPYVELKREGFVRTEDQAASFAAEPQHYLAAPPANRMYSVGSERFRSAEGELFLGLTISLLVGIGLAPALGGRRLSPGLAATAVACLWISGTMWLSQGKWFGWHPWFHARTLSHIFLGLAALLAAGGYWRGRKRPAPEPPHQGPVITRWQWFYLLLSVVAFWASLGPQAGLYTVLYRLVPGFNALRVPSRLAVLVTLGWAVLAAGGMWRISLSRTWGRARRLVPLTALCCGLILLDSTSAPFPWAQIYGDTPQVYHWLAQQPAGDVVLELPTMGHQGDQARDARYLYWSTKHGHTLINGYSGYFPQDYRDLTSRMGQMPDPALLRELWQRGARLLVVHYKEYARADRARLQMAVEDSPYLEEVFADQWDRVYRLRDTLAQP